MPQDTGFFIALDHNGGIYGIGTTAEAAVDDAWKGANTTTRPRVDEVAPDAFTVVNAFGDDVAQYEDRADAEAHVAQLGFEAHPCPERLYRHVKTHGCNNDGATGYGWRRADGVYDLVLDEDEAA
jgi:hypothetical protein